MNNDINEILKQLSGKKLSSFWRKSHMLWLGIGNLTERTAEDGKKVKVSEFTLEIQSAWRIINSYKKKIIVASADVFVPNRNLSDKKNFGWDIQGNNLLDEKLKIWFDRKTLYIRECKLSDCGNLLIIFSNNNFMEIFVNSSDYITCWILSRFQEKEEVLVTGLGCEIR